jgi:hypothetical protein
MDSSASGNDPQAQQSQSSIALGKRPGDEPPQFNILELAYHDNNYHNTDEFACKAAEMRALCYTPLEGSNIRLITIDHAMQDGKLKLTMDQMPLTDELDFHVLSYVWGDSTDQKTIIVNDQRLDITQNLYDFLEATHEHEKNFLVHHEHPDYRKSYATEPAHSAAKSSGSIVIGPATIPTRFWIDAICINQDDMNEKNEQVPRMGDTYSMATRVWIWMGLPTKILGEYPDLEVLKRGLDYGVQDSFKQPASPELTRPPDTPLIEQFADHQRQVYIDRTVARMRAMGIVLQPGPMMDMIYHQYAQISDQASSEHKHAFFNKFLRQLASLLGQPYLKRVWIIQEYVLNHTEPIALLGNFVLELQHIFGTILRLSREAHSMNEHSKALVFAVIGQADALIALHQARMQWHGSPPYDHKPMGSLTRLSPAERLNHLLRTFSNRRCTNPLDRFYGILGFFDHSDLPRSLLPDYSLPVEQVSQAYTRYIIESTDDLQMIECSMGHESSDCPSWVARAESLTARYGTKTTVSRGNKPHSFSEDGRRLTLEGTFLGDIVKCSCTDRPGESMGEHLKYLDDELFETASQITGKPKNQIFRIWLNTQLDVHIMLPSYFRDFVSVQAMLRRYEEVCEGIPPEALDGLNRMSTTQKHIIFQTPCRDPDFLYAVFRLVDPRFCLLSTGDILMCLLKHTDTNVMSRTHGENDCAWALKGFHLPAILRPRGEAYEYCGPLISGYALLANSEERKAPDDYLLDDEFFAARKVQQVTLV